MHGGGSDINQSIILFDGVCNLCNRWVNFVIDRDPSGRFRFAALQSGEAQDLLRLSATETTDVDSILLFDGERVYQKSDAILSIVSNLSGGWPLLKIFRVIPRFVRDSVYDVIARHRYSLFGRTATCRVPTKDLLSRFL